MKKIVILGQRAEAIPAVNGGAVATLMEMLIAENESQKKLDLTIICCDDEKARQKARDYPYTKFIFLRESSTAKVIYRLLKYGNKIFPLLSRIMKSSYLWQAYCLLKTMADVEWLVVEEDCQVTGYYKFSDLPMSVAYHSHLHEIPQTRPLYDRIIVVSQFCQNPWLSYYDEKDIKICYNAIDLNLFTRMISNDIKLKLRAELGFGSKDIIVLYVGRILAVKGVRELVKAVAAINDESIKLLLVGGTGFAEAQKNTYELQIDEMIAENKHKMIHIGYMSNDKLWQYYQLADIQCIPSLWEEAAGLVAIEGMASGLPLIVTQSGGMTEYVSEECAVIIERNENLINNLRQEIIKLAYNPQKRKVMGEKSFNRAKRFTQKQYYENFISAIS
ncbi:glycosyltransferase family 4 protein [Selenomonas ruminantium]|nr:glycosyltransferase family 4 protein [Selenomonas ruminantium]